MAKFILFDVSNQLIARYDSEVNGENIPDGAVEVLDDVFFQTIAEVDGVWMRDPKSGVITKQPFPPPSYEQLAEMAEQQRSRLLADAALHIAPLQDAADLEIATTAELLALTAWKQYRVALMRIEQQPAYPGQIDWPQVPQ